MSPEDEKNNKNNNKEDRYGDPDTADLLAEAAADGEDGDRDEEV